MNKLKVLELFGGIGACSKALERLGIDYEIADYVEIDKFAVASFNAMHGTNFEPQDICNWNKDIEVDLIMHGSPCQDFSLAGKQAGGDEGSGTRSSLMYETVRIVEKLKPKYVIWENVKNILSKKHRQNFDNYLNKMSDLGYTNFYEVLNAKDYGIPQNRERVFTVSILGNENYKFPKENIQECEVINPLQDISGKSWQFEQNVYSENSILRSLKAGGGSGNIPKVIENFEFPPKQELKLRLKDMLENEVDEKYYLSDTSMNNYLRNFGSKGKIQNTDKECDTLQAAMGNGGGNVPIVERKYGIFDTEKSKHQAGSVYDKEGLSPTLDTMQGGWRQPYIEINNGTKKGYDEAIDGDSVNLSYPTSKTRRGRVGHQVSQTLQCNGAMGVVIIDDTYGYEKKPRQYTTVSPTLRSGRQGLKVDDNIRIRKLTPKECWRLMGFDDVDFEKAEKVNSNTQLYKQAGNSIVVNVLEKILENLLF